MPLFSVGPGNQGYNFQPEFLDLYAVVELANGATCATGQVLCRDVTGTGTPSTAGADMLVLPTDALAMPGTAGVYQGPPITNSTGARANYPITVRRYGYGKVLAAGVAAAVNVGSNLGIAAAQLSAIPIAAAFGTNVGVAVATGAAVTKGAQIIASAGGPTLINAVINIQ